MSHIPKDIELILWFEHFLRLSGELGKSQEKKEKLMKEITESREYLDSMQPKLNSILQVKNFSI